MSQLNMTFEDVQNSVNQRLWDEEEKTYFWILGTDFETGTIDAKGLGGVKTRLFFYPKGSFKTRAKGINDYFKRELYTMFSERLKKLRQEKGLKQKELAKLLDIEPSKYNKWENGKNCPDYDTLCKLANFFGSTTDYLLGKSEQMYKNVDKALDSWKKEFKTQASDKLINLIKTM